MKSPDMVWVDLETTGLSLAHDFPLEIGLMTTDKYGNEIASMKSLVGLPAWQGRINDAKEDPVVGPMHQANGLWFNIDTALLNYPRDIAPRRVMDKCLQWLDRQGVRHGTLPVCGNSVRLDRDFMQVFLPEIDAHFHYRIIDVSSIKELCKMHNPSVYKQKDTYMTEDTTHRVMNCLHDSTLEYRFYLENFLWVDNPEGKIDHG